MADCSADCPAADCPTDCPNAPCPSPEPPPINSCYLWHHVHQGIDTIVLYDTVAAAYAAAHAQVALLKDTSHYWCKNQTDVMSDIDTNSFVHNHVFPDQVGAPEAKDRMWHVYQTADLQVYLGLGFYLPDTIEARLCPEGYNITDSNSEDPDMPPLFRGPIYDDIPSLVSFDSTDVIPVLVPFDLMPSLVPA